jgi:hypothetical protein
MRRRGFLTGVSLLALISGGALGRPAIITEPAGSTSRGEGPGPIGGAPTLDLNFINGTAFDPRITFSRASSGTYFDSTGTLQTAANDTPRIDYGPAPGGVTNWIRNSTMVGAISGTPGTAPTNWSVSGAGNGLTRTIALATINGVSGISIQIAGTTTAASSFFINPEAANLVSAVNGQAWTQSASLALIAGSLGAASFASSPFISDSGGTGLTILASANISLSPTPVRDSISGTIVSATAAFIQPRYRVDFASGITFDATIFIAAPQLESGAVANAWVPTSGAVVTAGATPLGLLIEEARTNWVRNARLEGSTPGTPGVKPTNWAITAAGGLVSPVTSIVGTGIENGIPYVDLSLSATLGASLGVLNLSFEAAGIVPALAGQAWIVSHYGSIVSGALPVGTTNFMRIGETASGGGATASTDAVAAVPAPGALATQRLQGGVTLSGATTAFATPGTHMVFPIGSAAFSFTYRIGLPQFEQAATISSPLMPAIGVPAATARATDNATVALGLWYNPNAGSLVAGAVLPVVNPPNTNGILCIDDGTANNRLSLRDPVGSNASSAIYVVANVVTTTISPGTLIANTIEKIGVIMAPGSLSGDLNAGAVTSSSGAAPTGLTTLRLGQNAIGVGYLNGYVRRFRYWPRLLSSTELQAATL